MKDNEQKGIGNSINYKERIQDTRLGRFMSTDPLTSKYAYLSSYQFAGNNPIRFIDRDGLEPAENPDLLNKTQMTDFGSRGIRYVINATDIKSGKPKDWWVFQRELPKMAGHEYLYYTSSGHWEVFRNDALNAQARHKAFNDFADQAPKVLLAGMATPLAPIGGGTGLTMRVFASGGDMLGQLSTNGFSLRRLNITSIIANGLFTNPFASEATGQALNYSYDRGFQESFVFGDQSTGAFLLNTAIGGGADMSISALKLSISTSGGTQTISSTRKDLISIFGNNGAGNIIGVGNALSETAGSTTGNMLQNAVSDEKE